MFRDISRQTPYSQGLFIIEEYYYNTSAPKALQIIAIFRPILLNIIGPSRLIMLEIAGTLPLTMLHLAGTLPLVMLHIAGTYYLSLAKSNLHPRCHQNIKSGDSYGEPSVQFTFAAAMFT